MKNINNFLTNNLELPIEEITNCNDYYTVREVEKGEVLLRQGEICKGTFFVEEGLLRMYSIDNNGKMHLIQFAPENWLISDRSSQFFDEKSNYFIDAIENSTVMVLNNDFITAMAEKYPKTAEKNELLLQNHIRNLQNRINSLMAETAEQRYLNFIKTYPDIMLRVPQWMVASYLGILPESLSRVRKELARKNFKMN